MSTGANWDGMLKRRYGPLVDPLPSPNTLAEFLAFDTANKLGDDFQVEVKLGLEHGVTRDNTRTSFTLLGAKDSITKPARLSGSAINIQGRIPRPMLAAMANGNEASYGEGLDNKVTMLAAGLEFAREVDLHYGAGGGASAAANIGVVSTIVSGTNLGAGGPIVADLTRASYAQGLWNLMVGGLVDIYESGGAVLVESDVEVTAVDHENCRVTLSKTGVTTDVDATDWILPRSAKGKSCYGVQAILENTGSLFGISAAQYPQWKAVQFNASGAMTRAKVMAVGAKLRSNGLSMGGKMFVHANTFADLSEELSDQQRYVDSGDVMSAGAANLLYKTPCGVIDVAVDDLMKQGAFFLIGKGVGKRVGTTDNTFRTPGSRQWFFQELENAAGAQMQGYTEQAPLIEIPYHCAIGSGLTNTADDEPSA